MKMVATWQLITFVLCLSVLVVIAMVSVLFQVKVSTMTRDVTAIANIHPLSGILSNLGILLWCAAASVCFFTAMILRHAQTRETFWFLLFSALLTSYLLLDDFFLFHEELIPQHLGLDEEIIFLVFGVVVSTHFIVFRQVIWRTNFGVLLLALGFLMTSIVIDIFLESWLLQRLDHWEFFLEDGAKWLGIASWCSYYMRTSHQFLVSILKIL